MKTETKKQEKCQVELTVTLEAGESQSVIRSVERTFMREAALPGFRKGKVPLPLIRKTFADQMNKEIEQSVFRKYIDDAIKGEKLEVVAVTDLKDVKCGEEGGAFTAVVEVRPEFKLPVYKGLKVTHNDTTVDDKAVSEQVERLRLAYSKYEDAKEGDEARDGDYVQIDYSGTVGGKPIIEIAPEAKIVASGTGFWTQLEEGRFLPEILDAIRGMKIGETKEGVKAKFDKAAAPEGLKGEKAVYTVTVRGIRHRIRLDDAEFAAKAKAESVEKLAADIKVQMEKSAVEQEMRRREQELLEQLMKKCDFEVPQSVVQRAMQSYIKDFAERAQNSGLDASYFEQNKDKILKDAEDVSVKQVRMWYVIEAIAKAENIEGKDEELGKKVMDFISENAKVK